MKLNTTHWKCQQGILPSTATVSKHWKNSFHILTNRASFSQFLTELQSSGKGNKTASVPLSVGTKRGVRCSERKIHIHAKWVLKMHCLTVKNLPRCMIIQKSKLDSSKNDWDPRGHRIWAPIITAKDKTELKAVQNSKTTYKNTATRSLTSDLVLQLHPMLCPPVSYTHLTLPTIYSV